MVSWLCSSGPGGQVTDCEEDEPSEGDDQGWRSEQFSRIELGGVASLQQAGIGAGRLRFHAVATSAIARI